MNRGREALLKRVKAYSDVVIVPLAVAAVGNVMFLMALLFRSRLMMPFYFTSVLFYADHCYRRRWFWEPELHRLPLHQVLRRGLALLAAFLMVLLFPSHLMLLYFTFIMLFCAAHYFRLRSTQFILHAGSEQYIFHGASSDSLPQLLRDLRRRLYALENSDRAEVLRSINEYAVFMGYLTMGVRGLGVLIVTWTTVVLLGGFVSDLHNKDFWCLAGIMLIQTAGVFNFVLKEKSSDMVHSLRGLIVTVFATVMKDDTEEAEGIFRLVIAYILMVVQVLVLGILLFPIAVLYMLGLYISTGVSLWRLIERDDLGDAGGANQKPALQVLYTLAVAQGVLFGYKAIYARVPRVSLVKFVAARAMVDEDVLAGYLEETVAGCEKDPSFATGWNLVRYGVEMMMEAQSNEGFNAGIKVLGEAIKDDYHQRYLKVLAEHLLTRSTSWGHMIQRLLEIVSHRSPHSRQVREQAASIVAVVACDICLEQFPRAIEWISSMLDTSDEESNQILCKDYRNHSDGLGSRKENRVHGFDGLLTEAVNIIHQLAVDEDNLRIMSNTTVLVHRIAMAPLKLHRDNHDACCVSQNSELQMLEKCWVLTEWLVAANSCSTSLQPAIPLGIGGRRKGKEILEEDLEEGEEERLYSRVSTSLGNAITNAIKSIFDCRDCRATQKKQGIQILLHLSLDLSFIMDNESRKRRLTWILLLIFLSSNDDSKYWMISGFTDRNKNMCGFNGIKKLAGEKLWDMLRGKRGLPTKESGRELQSICLALEDLTREFADDAQDIADYTEYISIRTHATTVIEGLCVEYNPSSPYAKEVEGILVGVIPKVVKEILILSASKREERQAQGTDVEKGGASQDDQDSYTDNERLRKSLVSLCKDGYMSDGHLSPKFKEIASKICKGQGKSFKYFKSILV